MIRITSGVAVSNPAVFNIFEAPFAVGIACVVTGTATYTIQHTFDDIINLGAAAVTWFSHDDPVLVGATANQDSNFAYPVTAARINQTVGSGTVTATFIQGGRMG